MLACFGKARSERRRDGRDGKAFLQTVSGHAHSTWVLAAEGGRSLGRLDLGSGAKLVLTHLSGTILEAKAYVQLLASWIAHDLYFASLLECFHQQVQRPEAQQPRTFMLNVFSSFDKPSCGLSTRLRVQVTHLRSLTVEHLPHEENGSMRESVEPANGSDARLETGGLQGWHQANGEHPGYHACSASELEAGKASAAATAAAAAPTPTLLPPPLSPLLGPAVPPLRPAPSSPLQGPAAQDHRRSALMLFEVPASITLLSKDCLVLDQNQGSIEQYGPIVGEKMWRAKNVEGKAMQELPGYRDHCVRMSGPLPTLFGPSSADVLHDLLEHIHQPGAGPWRCTIPVGPRAPAPPAPTAMPHEWQLSRSFNTSAHETRNHESGCTPSQPQQPSLVRPSSTVVKSNRLASQMNLRDRAGSSFTCQQQKSKGVRKRRSCSNLVRESHLIRQSQLQLQQEEQQLHAVSTLDELEEALQQQQQQQQQQQRQPKLRVQLQERNDDSGTVPTAKRARRPNASTKPSRTWSDLRAATCGGLPPLAEEDPPLGEAARSCKSSPKHHGPKRRHTFHAFQHKQQQKQQQQRQQVTEVQRCIGSPPGAPNSLTSWSSQSSIEGARRLQRPRASPGETRSSQVQASPGVDSPSKVANTATGACCELEEAIELGPRLSSGTLSARKFATPAAFPWGPVDGARSPSMVPVIAHSRKSTLSEIASRPSKRVFREEGSMEAGDDDEEEELDEEVHMEHQEVEMRPVVDPVTNQPACLLIQRDVTEQAKLERLLSQMTEDQLQMLSQIFPRHVIEALSTGVLTTENLAAMAKQHSDVTILFVDIVGFTSMSKDVHAEEVILFLNLLFSRFDRLLAKHQMQKIDTIGDCLIASSGILAPDDDGFMSVDEHHNPSLGAGRALALAIDMMRTASEVQMPNKEPVQLRIGAHTGPCVSGLMGVETPKWSVFGDTVNTASRMESHGYPMCIQISRATYDLLPKHVGVELRPSGGVAMKGKGVMETWVWRSPPDWTSIARESSGSTGRLPLSAERLYQFCYQPERAIRQPGSNPPSSLRLPHLKASKQQSLDETGEPNPINLGHHPAVNRSTVAPLTESLAASLHRHRHTRASSTLTTDLPSDMGFAPMAAMGRSRRDSVSNLQGLVMLVGGNDSGTGFARYASQKRESDGLPPTPFAIMSQRASCAEGPPEAQPPPPPQPATEKQAAAPAVAAAAGTGSVGTGAVEAGARKAGAAEGSMEAGAEKLVVLGTLASETGAPEGGSSETGAHVVHTFADMPSKRHMASSGVLPPQHATLRDLEDPDNHGLATSPGNDNSRQAEFGAGTSVLARTLQPQQQHHHHHHHLLQKPSTGTGQQQQARYFDHRAAALNPHPFPPQPRAPSSASSSSALFSPPISPLQEESQTPGFAFPHIVLPLHDVCQADLTPSRSTSPSRSPSSHTHVLRQQHHRDHPQQPPTPQVPASTTLHRPKKRASFFSRASWASEESQTDVDRGKSAGLPKINSSNTAGTTQDSMQDSRSLSHRNSFLLHLPASSVVHTHAALLDAELAQHRRRKSMSSRPRVIRGSSFHKPTSTSPMSSQPPSTGLPLVALSQLSLNPPASAAPEALYPAKDTHAAETQAEQPPRGHISRCASSHGVRATAATLAQRVMAHAARPGRVRTEGRYHGSCSNVIQPPNMSCSNAAPLHQASVSQGYASVGVGDAFARAHTPKCDAIVDHSSDEWDMRRPAPWMA